MPPRRRSGSSFRRGTRRKTTWFQSTFTHSLTTSPVQLITDISHPAIVNNNEPIGTCLRLMGNYAYTPLVGTAQADYNLAVGVCIVTIDALAAAAVPDPGADVTQDWYYWDSWEGGLLNAGLSTYTQRFDIRSARRLRDGYRLIWTTDNVTQELAGDVQIRLRTLWAMP